MNTGNTNLTKLTVLIAILRIYFKLIYFHKDN